jgi:hypothetical protein
MAPSFCAIVAAGGDAHQQALLARGAPRHVAGRP